MKALYKQYSSVPPKYLKEKIDLFIAEDKAEHDLSTLYINQSPQTVKAHIIAEEKMIFVDIILLILFLKKRILKKM